MKKVIKTKSIIALSLALLSTSFTPSIQLISNSEVVLASEEDNNQFGEIVKVVPKSSEEVYVIDEFCHNDEVKKLFIAEDEKGNRIPLNEYKGSLSVSVNYVSNGGAMWLVDRNLYKVVEGDKELEARIYISGGGKFFQSDGNVKLKTKSNISKVTFNPDNNFIDSYFDITDGFIYLSDVEEEVKDKLGIKIYDSNGNETNEYDDVIRMSMVNVSVDKDAKPLIEDSNIQENPLRRFPTAATQDDIALAPGKIKIAVDIFGAKYHSPEINITSKREVQPTNELNLRINGKNPKKITRDEMKSLDIASDKYLMGGSGITGYITGKGPKLSDIFVNLYGNELVSYLRETDGVPEYDNKTFIASHGINGYRDRYPINRSDRNDLLDGAYVYNFKTNKYDIKDVRIAFEYYLSRDESGHTDNDEDLDVYDSLRIVWPSYYRPQQIENSTRPSMYINRSQFMPNLDLINLITIAPTINFSDSMENTFRVGDTIDLMDGVSTSGRKNATLSVLGKVNTNNAGANLIAYEAKDEHDALSRKYRFIRVLDATKEDLNKTVKEAEKELTQNDKIVDDDRKEELEKLIKEAKELIDKEVDGKLISEKRLKLINAMELLIEDNEAPLITGIEDTEIFVGEDFDPREGVSTKDNIDKEVEVNIEGKVDSSKVGIYEIIYSAKDSVGNETKETRKITVKSVDKTLLKNKINEGKKKLENIKLKDDENKRNLENIIEDSILVANDENTTREEMQKFIKLIDSGINKLIEEVDNSNTEDDKESTDNTEDDKDIVPPNYKDEENKKPITFSDLDDNHWAKGYIEKLVKMKAITGYPGGVFKPEDNITRAEFTSILVKTLNLDNKSGKIFSDTKNHWAKEVIAMAMEAGIVKGINDTHFAPDEKISREQMAAMIVRAIDLSEQTNSKKFKDADAISDWAKEYVDMATKQEIIQGYPDGSFKPLENATRAEASKVISVALDRNTKK